MQEVEVSLADAVRGSVPDRVAALCQEVRGAPAEPVFVKIKLPLQGAQALPQPYGAACECSDQRAGPHKKAKVHDPRAALRDGLDSLPPLGDPLVASLRAQLDDVPPSAPPPAVPGYSLPDRLSARLAIDWPRPAEREAIRRCLYYLRWKNAQQQAEHRPPAEAPAQPPVLRTRRRSQGRAQTRLPPARFELETTIYERLHAGAPSECKRCRCRQRFREGLARDLAAWLPLIPTPTELTQLLIAGEPLYELYRLAREEGGAVPHAPEIQHWSTVCEQVLRLCLPGLGPFRSAEPGTDGYAALQRLFGAGRGGEEHATARVWIYCLALELHRAGGRGMRELPCTPPRPDDLAYANLPPAPRPASDVRPLPLPYNFWPKVLLSEADGLARSTYQDQPLLEPLVLLEHDLAIACASSFKQEVGMDITLDDHEALDDGRGLREVSWGGPLAAVGQALAVQVTRLEDVGQQPPRRCFFFFHGAGLLNPHLRRSLPVWPLLTEDGAGLQEPNPLVEDEWPGPLCLDREMHKICAQWAHRPLRLRRLPDGRAGYAAELPLNPEDRKEAEARFRSMLTLWLRPFHEVAARLNGACEDCLSCEVVLDRRPPYLLEHRPAVTPASAGHEGTKPEHRFQWQQLGWDRELRWSADRARDRRALTLRSLLVGALGVLDARLNPVVSAAGQVLLYSGQADVGAHEHTALRRLCVALSLLRELDPGWHCPGKLCPVSIHLGFGDWPHAYHYGDDTSDQPQVQETDFTVYVCSSHDHAFLLCKQRTGSTVKLTIWDSNGSQSGTYEVLQLVCSRLALRDQSGQRLARLLGLAEAGLAEASLGCYLFPQETPALQKDEGSCATHALLLAAVAVVDGPDRLPKRGAQDLSDAWLLLGSALGLRWVLPPEERARLLFLPPEEAGGGGGTDGWRETAVLRPPS